MREPHLDKPGIPEDDDHGHRSRAIRMLNDPKGWPYWPHLPMKRRYRESPGNNGVAAGFCVTADYPTIVLRGFPTMSGIITQLAVEAVRGGKEKTPGDPLRDRGEAASDAYEQAIVKRYDSIDEMLDDGWTVD